MADRDHLVEAHLNLTEAGEELLGDSCMAQAGREGGPWNLYDTLIEDIPDDICVRDYALGLNWSIVEADCGAGVAYTVSDGAKPSKYGDLRGRTLKEVARLSKSWSFKEATLGIAALNAWYGRIEHLEDMGAVFDDCKSKDCDTCDSKSADLSACVRATDAFDAYESEIKAFADTHGRLANVVVVGHFPHVEDIAKYAQLTVLERRCRGAIDTPDPACEYVLPEADYAFLTGVTLINKTAPRLLQLCKNAKTIMVGPSAVASLALFDDGVDTIAGRSVVDPERARFSVVSGESFGDSLLSFLVNKR